MPDGISLEPVAPAEAIAALRRRGLNPFPSYSWLDVDAQTHRAGFTVAKSVQFDVVGDIYAELQRALSEGRTFDQFKNDLAPTLKAKGWWGRAPMTDPETGETGLVQLGSERRLRIIFDTNLRMSHSEARWRQIQRAKDRRPYLRYVAVLDARTRPEHRRWHGTILPVDHPWWRTHFPPNGWRCRCMVQQLSERDLKRNGWKVTEAPPPDDPRPWRNRRTGEERQVPDGIDPGFDHNPGALAMEEDGMRAALDKVDAMREAGAPAAVVDAGRGALDAGPAGPRPTLETPPGLPPKGPPPEESPPGAAPAGTGTLTPLDRTAQAALRLQLTIDGNEWLRAYDMPTGALIAEHTDGRRNAVTPPPALRTALADRRRRIALHHSHPGDGAFSVADLADFAGSPGMATLGAHGPRASYVIRRVPRRRYGTRRWREETGGIELDVVTMLADAVEARVLTVEEANLLHPWLRLRYLADAGWIDLATEGDQLERDLLRRMLGAMADDE